jgi:hypothetical protein
MGLEWGNPATPRRKGKGSKERRGGAEKREVSLGNGGRDTRGWSESSSGCSTDSRETGKAGTSFLSHQPGQLAFAMRAGKRIHASDELSFGLVVNKLKKIVSLMTKLKKKQRMLRKVETGVMTKYEM